MKWVIGIDEVGRGPLAGPVYVCATAMPVKEYKKKQWFDLNDSKKMTAKAREKWHKEARAMEKMGALRIAMSNRTAKMIDRKGIAVCIRECIAEALEKLQIEPKDCTVLLDGSLKAPVQYKDQKTIIKGDSKEKIISLASVIAKVSRDRYMQDIHRKYPLYGWDSNKGYGTQAHIKAIKAHKISLLHRVSFLNRIIDKK